MLRIKPRILASVSVGILLLTPTAPAAATPVSPAVEAATIAFGHFESDDWPTVRAAMVATNGAEKVEAFLREVAKNPASIGMIPGLSKLAKEVAIQELVEPTASSFGRGGAPADSMGPFGASAAPDLAGARIMPMSYSTAPVAGTPINSNRSWQYSNRYNYTTCSGFTCSTNCWVDFRLTSNPGLQGSNTDYNLLRYGSCIGAVTFNLEIWNNSGSRIKATSLYTTGSSGRIYQQPYSTQFGRTIYFYYDILIQAPAPGNAEWKSRGAFCGGSSTTAYCRWS